MRRSPSAWRLCDKHVRSAHITYWPVRGRRNSLRLTLRRTQPVLPQKAALPVLRRHGGCEHGRRRDQRRLAAADHGRQLQHDDHGLSVLGQRRRPHHPVRLIYLDAPCCSSKLEVHGIVCGNGCCHAGSRLGSASVDCHANSSRRSGVASSFMLYLGLTAHACAGHSMWSRTARWTSLLNSSATLIRYQHCTCEHM